MGYQSAATVAEMDGKKLKAVLAKHGYKPAHLAKALGVSETATSKYTCFPQSAHVISPIPTACHRRAKNKLNFVLDHWFSRG